MNILYEALSWLSVLLPIYLLILIINKSNSHNISKLFCALVILEVFNGGVLFCMKILSSIINAQDLAAYLSLLLLAEKLTAVIVWIYIICHFKRKSGKANK